MSARPIRYRTLAQDGGALHDDLTRRRLEERLTRELKTFAPGEAGVSSTLTDAVCDYARYLRDAAVPSEQAVVALKRIIQAVIPREFATDPLRVHDRTRQLITTCIEAYYGKPQLAGAGFAGSITFLAGAVIALRGRVSWPTPQHLHQMNPPYTAIELTEALQTAVLGRDIDNLVSTVGRFASRMRDAGVPRQEAIALVDRAIDGALRVEGNTSASLWLDAVDRVEMRAIAACVDIYGLPSYAFGDPGAPSSRSHRR